MPLPQLLREKVAAEKRTPITISIEARTIRKLEELAKEGGISVSLLAGEILNMGLAVGESIEVLNEQMQGFADKILTANDTLTKAQKVEVKKAVKKKFPVGFSGKRKKR